jgi:membrane-bound serine protease (ClpP class)
MTLLPYVLLTISLVLIFFEFFIPGGLFAIVGTILFILSFFSFASLASPLALLLFAIGAVLLLILVIRLAISLIKKSGKENTLLSDKDQQGYQASSLDPSLFGKVGIATTVLKPTGKIEVDGQIVQAASNQGYIVAGTAIKIVGGEGAHYIVRIHTHGT